MTQPTLHPYDQILETAKTYTENPDGFEDQLAQEDSALRHDIRAAGYKLVQTEWVDWDGDEVPEYERFVFRDGQQRVLDNEITVTRIDMTEARQVLEETGEYDPLLQRIDQYNLRRYQQNSAIDPEALEMEAVLLEAQGPMLEAEDVPAADVYTAYAATLDEASSRVFAGNVAFNFVLFEWRQ